MFLFICELGCSINKDVARRLIFEVFLKTYLRERFDLSQEFFQFYNAQDPS